MTDSDNENSTLGAQPSEAVVSEVAKHISSILELIGEDPGREGLVKTPERAARALLHNVKGYRQDAQQIIRTAVFGHEGSQMVIVRDIEFYSLCEHHILPFFGTVSIGYIPDGKIVGLSKLARAVDAYARRLQVQERLTGQICQAVSQALPNKGVIVLCRADHMCMRMRGVEKQQSQTMTVHYTGDFSNAQLRSEFMAQLRMH